MALQNFQYDIIMREYNRRQSQVQHDLEERRAEAFARVPRLLEIDGEVAALSAQKARSLLQGEPGSVDDLKKDVSALSAERRSLLKKNGFSEDYLEPHYFCPICQDTGYADGQKCSCFKKAEIEVLYTQSNLTEILKKENFEHFSFDWYSDTMKNEATGLTARETAKRAYNTARNFVDDFDKRAQNLFLYCRPFSLTVLPASFSKPHTVFCIFLHLICLTVWLRQLFPENPKQTRVMILFLTVIF